MNKFVEAALELCDEASSSVEYSDWPELQQIVEKVRTLAITVEASLTVESASTHAMRFASALHEYTPPRLRLQENNEATIALLAWQTDFGGLLIAVSHSGAATYAIKMTPDQRYSMSHLPFYLTNPLPEEQRRLRRYRSRLHSPELR